MSVSSITSQTSLPVFGVFFALHLIIIALSNYLVQLPLTIAGVHTTYGAFTFPLIFVLTDLTVRLFGASVARRVIFSALLPALLLSYAISVLFYEGHFMGLSALGEFNTFVARIALASLVAYGMGQLLDILIFNRLRDQAQWWLPAAISTVTASIVDTYLFFGVAFYQSSDTFMATHWVDIAHVDLVTKILVSLLLLLPVYGLLLAQLKRRLHLR